MPFVVEDNVIPGPRQPITATEQRQALEKIWEDQAVSDAIGLKIFIGLAFVAVAIGVALYRRRAAIVEAADDALIQGAAGLVKGSRSAQRHWRNFKERVEQRADANPRD